jgi:hypothetical protein
LFEKSLFQLMTLLTASTVASRVLGWL